MTLVFFVVLQQRLATIETFRLLLANHIVGIDFPALPNSTSFAYHSNTVLVLALCFGILVLWQLRRTLGKTFACFWQHVQSWIALVSPLSNATGCVLFGNHNTLSTIHTQVVQIVCFANFSRAFFQGVLRNFKRKPWCKRAVLGKPPFQQCNGVLVRKRGNVLLFSTQAVQIAQKKREFQNGTLNFV